MATIRRRALLRGQSHVRSRLIPKLRFANSEVVKPSLILDGKKSSRSAMIVVGDEGVWRCTASLGSFGGTSAHLSR